MFDRVVIAALRMPLEIVAKVMHLNLLLLDLVWISGHVWIEVTGRKTVVVFEFGDRRAAQVNLGLVFGGEIGPVTPGALCIQNWVTVFGFVLAIEHQRNLV